MSRKIHGSNLNVYDTNYWECCKKQINPDGVQVKKAHYNSM